MSLAPLHPSHGTEPTPIFAACQVERTPRAIVRNGLRVHTGGRMPRKSTTRLRILNESPVLYALTGGA